ncbi:MAG: hypothetical protein CMJ75_13245 [Planctomycetaceae bacterium]|nr:hypothetical protein [Planctomycetaceae bacterium]
MHHNNFPLFPEPDFTMPSFPSAQIIQLITHGDAATAARLNSEAANTPGLTHQLRATHDTNAGGIFLWSDATVLNAFEETTGLTQLAESGNVQSRVFDILQPTSSIAFDTAGEELSAATSILLVNMHLRIPLEAFLASVTGPDAEATGKLFGAIPGLVGKVFLHSRQVDDIIGGCYLFTDDQSRSAYLASDLFAAVGGDENWENLSTMKLSIAGN